MHSTRKMWLCLGMAACIAGSCSIANSADKEKNEKEKKEKVETWVEVATPQFVVTSDGGEKMARHFADEFSGLRSFLLSQLPNAHAGNGIPIEIMVAKDDKAFAKLFYEYPSDKRHTQPPGLFLQGPGKTYIAIRANAYGAVPYEDIFQQYAKTVISQSYRNLPPWVEEGCIAVFGNLIFVDKMGIKVGPPDPEDLSKLYENPLLPIEVILGSDRNSAYYNAGSKQTMYFAESRALVNYLVSDPQAAREEWLSHYIAQVQGGTDSLKAARQVFGDLNQLQKNLDAFIKRTKPGPSDAFPVDGAEASASPRNLSPAELEVRIAELEFARGRTDSARERVEHAIELDSGLASANETHGYILLRQGDLDDAEKDFQKAVDLAPNDPLAYYGQAMVAKARGGFVGVPLGATHSLEKAVSIDPDFAEAWSELAAIYALRDETRKDALAAAQHAVSIAPGIRGYQDLVGEIQNAPKGGEVNLARNVPPPAQQGGRPSFSNVPPPPSTKASSATTSDRPRLESKTEPGDQPAPTAATAPAIKSTAASVPTPSPAASAPTLATTPPRIYSMTGLISEVSCADAPQLKITLRAQTIVMHLHADDVSHLSVKPSKISSGKNGACASLRDHNARISYTLASEKPWDGEIRTIELTSEP